MFGEVNPASKKTAYPFNLCNLVAIDLKPSGSEANDSAVDWEPVVAADDNQIRIHVLFNKAEYMQASAILDSRKEHAVILPSHTSL